MKRIPLSLTLAILLTGFHACQPRPAAQEESAQITTTKTDTSSGLANDIVRIHETFLSQSKEVVKRAEGLSAVEQEHASRFMYSAFDLVMESYVFKGDPARPALTVWMNSYRKFGGDNPHTIYTQFPVDEHYTYRLKGKLGNAFYFGTQVYGMQAGFNLATANLGLPDLKREKDGSIIIYLSAKRPAEARNWIPITTGDHAVLLREYFKGKKNTAGQFSIERVDSSNIEVSTYADRLKKANHMMVDYIAGTLEVCDLLKTNSLNQYPDPRAEVRKPKYGGALYPTKDNKYEGFWVSLKPGEAIHLHGKPPANTPYASYVFYDRWYTTPDYKTIQSYLTNEELTLNKDGSFDMYISPEEVKHPNWINTGGLYEGSFAIRYLLSGAADFPEVKLVKLSEVNFAKK
jgi:hypothetical protein